LAKLLGDLDELMRIGGALPTDWQAGR
jgi:hypothetical protein